MNRILSNYRPIAFTLVSFALTLPWTSLSHAKEMEPVSGYDRLRQLPQANRNAFGPAVRSNEGLPTQDTFGGGNLQRWTNGGRSLDPMLGALDILTGALGGLMSNWTDGLNGGGSPPPPRQVPPRQPNGRDRDNRTIPADEFEYRPFPYPNSNGYLNSSDFPPPPPTPPASSAYGSRRLGVYGHVSPHGGFVVAGVQHGNLAQRLGLEPGDEIVAVNGHRVWSANQIIDAVNSPSRTVGFTIRNVRNDHLIHINVRL